MDILLEHVSHKYSASPVLHNLNLHIESSEIIAVLGPSGCGKSTLLRLLGGLERPTGGVISTQYDKHMVAYVFQEPTLLPWRTVAANVSLPLEARDIPASERSDRVTDALARVKLSEFSSFYPKHLSGGMSQRASIARALVVRPEILLMDEPLASLDAATRDMLLVDLIRLWHESRFTCIYVTHSASEAVLIGHRVVVLSARPGSIREIVPVRVPHNERHESHPDIVFAHAHLRHLTRTSEAIDKDAHVD